MQTRPVMLDLFCGAGGSAMGYYRAGFDLIGVDNRDQPRYPFTFIRADAMTFPLEGVDAVHASPPCHDHSAMTSSGWIPEDGTGWMLRATLDRLAELAIPWVVENVVGAPLPSAVELCGASFGLGANGRDLSRHRRFQSNVMMLVPQCQHRRGQTIGVYGHGTTPWHREKYGRALTIEEKREAMGIDWMNRDELGQAIPPAMTQFIGLELLRQLF